MGTRLSHACAAAFVAAACGFGCGDAGGTSSDAAAGVDASIADAAVGADAQFDPDACPASYGPAAVAQTFAVAAATRSASPAPGS